MAQGIGLSFKINVDGAAAEVKFAEVGKQLADLGTKLRAFNEAAKKATLDGDALGAKAAREAAQALQGTIAQMERFKQAARMDHARTILDVQPHREIQREIDRTQAAYNRLAASGKLSGAELGQAFLHAQTKIAELKNQTNGWTAALEQVKGAAAALAGVLAGLAGAVKIAAGFESAMVDFARATGQTKDAVMGLSDEFRDLAQHYGMTADAVAGIATVGGKMGVAQADMSRFVDAVAQAAINFDMLPDEAAAALATLSAVLKIPVGELDAFAGAINAVADSVGVMERDLIKAMTQAGASAKGLGLARNETAAMAAAMIRLGATADTAGTAIRTFATRLQLAVGDSGKMGQALQSIVGDVRVFAELLYTDGQQAVTQFFAALNRMPPPERLEALRNIFGDGQDTENIAKLATGVDIYGKALAAASGDAEQFRSKLAELTGMKLDTTAQGFASLWQAIRNLADVLGQRLLPLVNLTTKAVNGLATGLRAIADAAPWFSTLAVAVGVAAAAVLPLRMALGALVVLLGKVGLSAAGVGAVTGAFAALGQILLRFVPWLAGIALAIDIGVGLWRKFGQAGDDAARQGEVAFAKFQESGKQAAATIKTELDTAASIIADRLKSAMERAGTAIKALGDDYTALSDVIKTQLDRQLDDITANGVAAGQSVAQTEREKVTAIETAGLQMERAWEKTWGVAVQLARTAGQDVKVIEQQAIDARIALYTTLETAYRTTVDRLIAEEQRHLQAARTADEQRAALRLSVEDRIRALQQRGMSDYAAYQDRLRQIDEKQAAAREALAKGNFDQAKKLAEQAMQLAEANAREVTQTVEQNGKKVTQTVVTLAQASAKAIGEVEESTGIIDQALQGMGDAGRQAAAATADVAAEARTHLERVRKEIDALQAQVKQGLMIKLEADASEVKAAVAEIEKFKDAAASVQAAKQAVDALEKALQAAKAAGGTVDIEVKISDVDKALADAEAKVAAANIQANVGFDNARTALDAFEGELKQLNQVATNSQHSVIPNTAAVDAEFARLNGMVTHSTHVIHTVQGNAAGGLIQQFAAGGQAFRRASGRIFGPGTGTSDSVPSMLSAGEFVVRAASVRKYGVALLSAINRGVLPPPALPHFAAGGLVAAEVGAGATAQRDTVDLRFSIGQQQHTVQSSRDTAMQLAGALRELSRGA